MSRASSEERSRAVFRGRTNFGWALVGSLGPLVTQAERVRNGADGGCALDAAVDSGRCLSWYYDSRELSRDVGGGLELRQARAKLYAAAGSGLDDVAEFRIAAF